MVEDSTAKKIGFYDGNAFVAYTYIVAGKPCKTIHLFAGITYSCNLRFIVILTVKCPITEKCTKDEYVIRDASSGAITTKTVKVDKQIRVRLFESSL